MAGTRQKPKQKQTIKQGQLVTQSERVAREERDSALQWNEIFWVPGRLRDCDSTMPPMDQSWRPRLSPVAEVIASRPPRAQWVIHEDLSLHYIDGALVQVAAERSSEPAGVRSILVVYIEQQKDFVLSGDARLLHAFAPQEEEYTSYFGDALAKVKGNRPTGILRGQYVYLPTGDLCAAVILHNSKSSDEKDNAAKVLAEILQDEAALFESAGKVLSMKEIADEMSKVLKEQWTENRCKRLFRDIDAHPSQHERRRQYAQRK
jgi:hypothetical protein